MLREPIISESNAKNESDRYAPDIEREDREWNRVSCTCGGMLGMVKGTLIRIRHRDRNHQPDKAVYVYIDLSGAVPEVIAEAPVKNGARKEHDHG